MLVVVDLSRQVTLTCLDLVYFDLVVNSGQLGQTPAELTAKQSSWNF